ncbi:MAG: four helix bundle suffix domain-containing protein [Alloprevotella sp.]|nr:four helix bundle suffix domain-containing protein [Alloprevotella sp.]
MENEIKPVLRKQANWEDLYFYQKSNVLYQLTFVFTKRFLTRGDRTIDQMVQAARSGKQNIVEGSADGVTSMEMELKLLNVARSSIKELKEDYEDYVTSRHLQRWKPGHERYDGMLRFCRKHNRIEDYQGYFEKWTDEEMANVALTLCHMVDRMMTTYQKQLEETFVKEGGIKERMTAARLGFRTNQREEIERLKRELETAHRRIAELEAELSRKR